MSEGFLISFKNIFFTRCVILDDYLENPNSELYNVTEEAWGNGNKSIISDLITKNITQTNAFDEYKADYITDTMGNHSIWVNEAYEISSNSKGLRLANEAGI